MGLSDEILENNFPDQVYPPVIPLMSAKDKLNVEKSHLCFGFSLLLKIKIFELYAHHALMLYLLFRRESERKVGNPPSYTNKLGETGVIELVNENRNKIEPYSELADNTLMHYNMELRSNEEQEPVLENYEIDDVTETEEQAHNTQNVVDISILHQQYFHSDDEISANIRYLNLKQRQVFDFVHSWAKEIKKVKKW